MTQSTTPEAININAYLDTASVILDLPIDETSRTGVTQFLTIAAQMAAVLDQVDLDDTELALTPVFLPPDAAPR